ncbi:MAG TPA: FadR/GntR family transcriptional regulator [Anaerolineales bacterium]|nr:FadR/GntR family transcriptional regulator [Anaerolineales bacterium]
MYKKLSSQNKLSHEAANYIRALIRSEQLKAGDKLPNEMQLAKSFGVSRPTVREAVQSLMSQNIIEIVRGKGTFVAQNTGMSRDPLGLDFLADPDLPLSLIEARRLIEPGVARLAAQRARAADVQKLERLLGEMKGIVTRDANWVRVEQEFHSSIARATQNPVIMRIVPVIVEAIVKSLHYAPRTPEDHRQAFREHSAILSAIREKSQEKAFQAMRQHLEASYRRTIRAGSQKK